MCCDIVLVLAPALALALVPIFSLETSRGIKVDWDRRNVVNGGDYNGDEGGKDGAMGAPRRDPERVGTDAPAEGDIDQHEERWDTTSDVPRPSTPPPNRGRRWGDYERYFGARRAGGRRELEVDARM